MPSSFTVRTSKSIQNPLKIGPKEVRGYPQESPERSKTAQGHPRAPQETPRDGQKAFLTASGSALEALWTLGRPGGHFEMGFRAQNEDR